MRTRLICGKLARIVSMIIYAIDDHPMLRDAVVMALRQVRPDSTIVELDSIEALEHTAKVHGPPELVSLDINLPDNDSHEGVARVRALFPSTRIAVFSTHPAEVMEEICIASGADIYVEKASSTAGYKEALQSLLSVEGDPDEARADSTEPAKLSKRQRQLLIMLESGRTNGQIALALALAETTIKVHLWKLYRKLGARNRTEAIHLARRAGLIK
jgi:DNA-binding NarL/FixJ family response regulator